MCNLHDNSLPLLLLLLLHTVSKAGSSCVKNFVEQPLARCVFPSTGPNGDITQCEPSDLGLWCPTTDNYCADAKFKWCPGTKSTLGGTDPGAECHFPFRFNQKLYLYCTRDFADNYLWCSTTQNYTGKWTKCVGTEQQVACSFDMYSSGIDKQCVWRNRQWQCRTDNGKYRQCPDTNSTEGGNDPGKQCHFPFKFNDIRHSRCIESDRDGSNALWCSTTQNYDRDRKWTMCKRDVPFRIHGLLLLIIVLLSVVLGACGTAYVLYCVSHHLHKLWRKCRQGRRQQQQQQLKASHASTTPPPPPPAPAPAVVEFADKCVETGIFSSSSKEKLELLPSVHHASPQAPPDYADALHSIAAAATAPPAVDDDEDDDAAAAAVSPCKVVCSLCKERIPL